MQFLWLILDNARRNLVRTVLTSLGTMVLVFVVTLVFSILTFLDNATTEKSRNLKAIVTERWQIPSQMPMSYAGILERGAPRGEGDISIEPKDSMLWSFYGGSIDSDPKQRTFKNAVFAFCLKPRSLYEMMDGLDDLPPAQAAEFRKVVDKLNETRNGIVVGVERLKAINKQVGDRFTLYGLNYRDINLEVEIVGTFPEGRYNPSAAMRIDYLADAMDVYERTNRKKHPLAEKSLNLVWLRLKDRPTFDQVAEQVLQPGRLGPTAVKCETASSGVSTFLDAYRDLIWGMRWLLAPSILITLALVISNAISISVRERRIEFAVLKVLGFLPLQILLLVLGEALVVGAVSGFVSSGGTYALVNWVMGGLKFPIAFFGIFFIPDAALWWGPVIGGGAAFLGSFPPAWSARTVKVSEVFSRVA